MVDKVKQQAGKAGAAALHKTRWEILKELSGLYSKEEFERAGFLKWKTKHLEILRAWFKISGNKPGIINER